MKSIVAPCLLAWFGPFTHGAAAKQTVTATTLQGALAGIEEGLRARTPEEWIEAQGGGLQGGLGFGPFIDGRLVTEPPWVAFRDDRARRSTHRGPIPEDGTGSTGRESSIEPERARRLVG